MDINSKKIINALRLDLVPFSGIREFPQEPGVYAIGFTGYHFPFPGGLKAVNKNDIIYIGKTEKGQRDRHAKTHFNNGKTGSSTLRRSLGAILLDDLELKPIPRSKSEIRMRDYKFIEESEKQLTAWMVDNLSLSYFIINEGKRIIRKAEIEIIKEISPVLNITHNSSSPYVSMLKELRKKCKLIAKEQG